MLRKVMTVMLGLSLALPATAVAQTPQHTNAAVYAYWVYDSTDGFKNVAQRLRVKQKSHHTFWAHFWRWHGSTEGGYVGLQTDGVRFDGSRGEMAIFSLWNATAATGASCGTFGGEGVGYSCRLPMRINSKHTYELFVKRLNADAEGQWWKANVRNVTRKKTRVIGRIRVPLDYNLIGQPMNFSEYWGPAVACDEVPVSIALWDSPRADKRKSGGYRYRADRGTWSRLDCTGGTVERHRFGTRGVKVTQGGPL